MKGRRRKFWKQSEFYAAAKEMEKMIEKLKESVVIVEGKRDQEALRNIGIDNTYAAAGIAEKVCKKMENEKEVVILTDLDRKGNMLAEKLSEYLWSAGVKTDTTTRRKLGRILRVKYFEEMDKKYRKFLEEGE